MLEARGPIVIVARSEEEHVRDLLGHPFWFSTSVMNSASKGLPTVSFLAYPAISKALLLHSVNLQSTSTPKMGTFAVSVS